MESHRHAPDSRVAQWATPRDDDVRWRHVTDTARDAIVGGDSNGLIVFWNPAAEQLFGYSESEVLGQPLTLLMPERFHAGHRAGLTASVAREGIPPPGRMVEIQALRRDGSEFPAELSLSSWRDGGAVYFTGVLRDISQRKRMEAELQQALAALELRVEQRTAQLSEMNQRLRQEIAERQRAEREVVEISLDQQRRIGQELHDHAGQRLTGLAYIAKGLELKLVDRGLPEAELARELAAELAEVVRHVQALARGLIPWEVTADELVASLAGLAELTVERSGVEVELWASPGFKPASDDMAVQL
ncbi:MAG TPA: PAS domain S-box protein, partial [Pirellulaceae bacterium]|nr:PAS domain S-box protein [Pirellulaceae bacterium]